MNTAVCHHHLFFWPPHLTFERAPCPGWRPQSVGHGAAFERMEAPEATAEYLVAMMSQTASSRTVGSLES
ncbi:hypothetical protein PR002_g1935 [Phytophthora rubi]|uniref:Uncharacterized protein n=1 Tax=Phytophthora rubi TaxID=129364 RepID=A0A6A3NWR9_9STRA|nr:hypothetical protein PR002_g1935 [Phytophthora rubi]